MLRAALSAAGFEMDSIEAPALDRSTASDHTLPSEAAKMDRSSADNLLVLTRIRNPGRQ